METSRQEVTNLGLKSLVRAKRGGSRGKPNGVYAKEVALKAVINARSAMSASMKRTVLSQEVLHMLVIIAVQSCPGQIMQDRN